jgi:hypothetical protein
MPGTDSAPDPAVTEPAIVDRTLGEIADHAEPTENELDAFREMYYERHSRLQEMQRRSVRRDRQLMFVFALLVAAFVLLAYRTETTDTKLREGFYDACVGRNAQSTSINQVRQVFIDRIAQGASGQTAEGKIAIAQLQSFLQPLEDCGPNPQ